MRRLTLIALALAAAVAPLPATLIEQQYSSRAYPQIQRAVTSFSNAWPIALFDLALASFVVATLVLLLRRGRILNLLAFASIVWLVFLAAWGLNYRRVPLSDRLGYASERVNLTNAVALTRTAVTEMNRLHAAAHAGENPPLDVLATSLAEPAARAARDLGIAPPLPARPKHTLLAPYFRLAGVDGMTDPFFLETLLNDTLLEVEQPAAIAHEWGHLAGFANEGEAGFFGWLACLRGDARAQYSGWVALYPYLLSALPEKERKSVHARLAAGPREDFRRITARLAEADPAVRSAANVTYDKFLRANRVDQGTESYDDVVRLIIGTRFAPGFVPERR